MISRLFNSQTKSITLSAGILAVSTVISGILSLIGDWLLAKNFGASADIYFASFRIPDFVYNILITGGVVVAFLPLFSEYFLKEKEKAWDFCSNLLNVFLFSLILLSLILLIFTPYLLKLVTPGFEKEQFEKTVLLTRILFLSPILLGLSNIFSGILQYFNRFLVYSLSPILYNLGIIFGILIFSPHFGILGVVFGVILGCLLHLLIQIPAAKNCGFKYSKIFNFKNFGIKRVFLLILPRALGISAQQLNLIIITAIASTLASGSISVFNFANNIQNFPIGIIGISFAIATFPVLSRAWAKNQKDEFIKNLSSTFRQIVFLIIPASILIFSLKNQIVMILLRHGQFSLELARLTAASLGIFAFGIFAWALTPLIFRAFFSFQDTKTPTLIAILSLIFNVFFSFYFTQLLNPTNRLTSLFKKFFSLGGIENIQIIGLPLAFSLTAIFQFLILISFLQKRVHLNFREILISFFKIILASFFMFFSINIVLNSFFASQTFFDNFLQLIISGFFGILTYFIFALFLKSPELKEILPLQKISFFC
ncbi:hypothetical protein AMJ49_02990 [Parcubacteria bacterium DG_74_2]|nr:MAG: hypothetical protein AMJ49_02990 [Parcubacteria bacterium DG_74_2]